MPSPKFNLRLPPDLQQRAADLAQAQGISLNAFITLAVGIVQIRLQRQD